jgi:hypothetical protein
MSNYPSISYAITVCNEHEELELLLNQLNDFVDVHNQIVIQSDEGNTTEQVFQVIDWFRENCKCEFDFVQWPLKNDFAQFKNNLKSHCRKDYIFQIDADELLGDGLCMNIHSLLAENGDNDVYFIPRINIVKGLTREYAESQNWNVRQIDFPVATEYNEYVVNFPDRQARLFKNKPEIKWRNKVHEVIIGHKSYIDMAQGFHDLDPEQVQAWCLIHIKGFDRQVKQNEKYSQITRNQNGW